MHATIPNLLQRHRHARSIFTTLAITRAGTTQSANNVGCNEQNSIVLQKDALIVLKDGCLKRTEVELDAQSSVRVVLPAVIAGDFLEVLSQT